MLCHGATNCFFLEKNPETGQPAMNSKISNAEELVKKTICKDVKREID